MLFLLTQLNEEFKSDLLAAIADREGEAGMELTAGLPDHVVMHQAETRPVQHASAGAPSQTHKQTYACPR